VAEQVVLGIDTAAGVSVGVAVDGVVVARRALTDSRRHVESLVPLVAEALEEAGRSLKAVTRIGVGVGPGPFTGLRVGIVAARTWAAAGGVPVRHVCSLDVVALAAAPLETEFVAALDARRHEVYWARYSPMGLRLEGPNVSKPETLPGLPVVGWCWAAAPSVADGRAREDETPHRVGWGGAVVPGVVDGRAREDETPPRVGWDVGAVPLAHPVVDAGVLAARLDELPEMGAEPLYLRRPDAAVSTKRKSVLGGRA
jgi:tRNA threonylcarbamoyl adenosine modification protein YeaZ